MGKIDARHPADSDRLAKIVPIADALLIGNLHHRPYPIVLHQERRAHVLSYRERNACLMPWESCGYFVIFGILASLPVPAGVVYTGAGQGFSSHDARIEIVVLLTLSTTHHPATDLGFLLHKNPARVQTFPLSFGRAHLFYPQATAARCTAALLLDIDPIGLVRG